MSKKQSIHMRPRSVTGFTLVELLIVIAILAVLSVTVVLVLNPAELLRQARDTRRLSDLSSIHRAISFYLVDQAGSVSWVASHNCTVGTASPMGGGVCVTNSSTVVTGTGWVDVGFSSTTTGSPLAALPLDPTNDATYFYAFKKTSGLVYELDSRMESIKYATTSATEVMSSARDGGNNSGWYEVGNEAGLDL